VYVEFIDSNIIGEYHYCTIQICFCQLLLIGCKDKEALDEIEKFCANSSGALPKRYCFAEF
jgi:hypothetical protein